MIKVANYDSPGIEPKTAPTKERVGMTKAHDPEIHGIEPNFYGTKYHNRRLRPQRKAMGGSVPSERHWKAHRRYQTDDSTT